MFTWILLAIIVAALFGVINVDKVRAWIIEESRAAWPHLRNFFDKVQEKTKGVASRVENKLDITKDKMEEKKDEFEDKVNSNIHN